MRYFRALLPRDPVIVEAGAHGGGDTVRLARAWPRGHVHAFEPVPSLFQRMSTRVRNRHNVSCYPLALSDKVGTAEIFVSSGASDASTLLARVRVVYSEVSLKPMYHGGPLYPEFSSCAWAYNDIRWSRSRIV
jgi:hypothetical protein